MFVLWKKRMLGTRVVTVLIKAVVYVRESESVCARVCMCAYACVCGHA